MWRRNQGVSELPGLQPISGPLRQHSEGPSDSHSPCPGTGSPYWPILPQRAVARAAHPSDLGFTVGAERPLQAGQGQAGVGKAPSPAGAGKTPSPAGAGGRDAAGGGILALPRPPHPGPASHSALSLSPWPALAGAAIGLTAASGYPAQCCCSARSSRYGGGE